MNYPQLSNPVMILTGTRHNPDRVSSGSSCAIPTFNPSTTFPQKKLYSHPRLPCILPLASPVTMLAELHARIVVELHRFRNTADRTHPDIRCIPYAPGNVHDPPRENAGSSVNVWN